MKQERKYEKRNIVSQKTIGRITSQTERFALQHLQQHARQNRTILGLYTHEVVQYFSVTSLSKKIIILILLAH